MPDAIILSVLGVEVEIRAWRGTDNLFEATFTKADGTPYSLANANVIFTVVDSAGGTVKWTETKTPGQHTNALGGVTRFMLGAAVFAGLTGQRPYTWKYQVVTEDETTHQKHIHFWGDLRVLPPFATV